MGLDDIIHDVHLKDRILEMCTEKNFPLLTYYSNLNKSEKEYYVSEENLIKWEESICYNGYSTVFHMLYPLIFNLAQGSSIEKITEEQKVRLRKLLREELIAAMKSME